MTSSFGWAGSCHPPAVLAALRRGAGWGIFVRCGAFSRPNKAHPLFREFIAAAKAGRS